MMEVKPRIRIGWLTALIALIFLATLSASASSAKLIVSPEEFEIDSGKSRTLTAKLTLNGEPLEGEIVFFTILASQAGSCDPAIEYTNSEGIAKTTYTAPHQEDVPLKVTIHVRASFAPGSPQKRVEATVRPGPGEKETDLDLSASSYSVEAEDKVTLTAKLTSNGYPVRDARIEFHAEDGSFYDDGWWWSTAVKYTNSNGKVEVIYRAPEESGPVEITAKFQGTSAYKHSQDSIKLYVGPKPKELDTQITNLEIDYAKYERGDSVKADVTVKNTGDITHNFYIGYSVRDRNGKWWDAPYKNLYLSSGDTGTVRLVWTVESDAPEGSYLARVAVWERKSGGKLYGQLDRRERPNAFTVKIPSDTTPPSVPRPKSPANGATLPNQPIKWPFDWWDSDDGNGSGVKGYQIYVIGPSARIPVADAFVTKSNYIYTSDGFIGEQKLKGWTWKVRAQDNAGNWSDWSESRAFNVSTLEGNIVGSWIETVELGGQEFKIKAEYDIKKEEKFVVNFHVGTSDSTWIHFVTVTGDANPDTIECSYCDYSLSCGVGVGLSCGVGLGFPPICSIIGAGCGLGHKTYSCCNVGICIRVKALSELAIDFIEKYILPCYQSQISVKIPIPPSNLQASAISSTQINLEWRDNSNNEAGFRVERKLQGRSYNQVAEAGANVTSYSDRGLSTNITYCYRVRAYNNEGNSSYSNEACATTTKEELWLTLFEPEVDGYKITLNGVGHWGPDPLKWDWGDGSITYSWFLSTHTYSSSGTYTIKVTACNSHCITETKTVKLGDGGGESTEVMDSIGDANPSFIDITRVKITKIDDARLRLEMQLAGSIPSKPDDYLMYLWSLDTDRNSSTGHRHDGIGANFNIRVAYDPNPSHRRAFGWHGWIDVIGGGWRPEVKDISYSGNTAAITLSLSDIGNPSSFNWTAHTMYKAKGDKVPNSGYAAFHKLTPLSLMRASSPEVDLAMTQIMAFPNPVRGVHTVHFVKSEDITPISAWRIPERIP